MSLRTQITLTAWTIRMMVAFLIMLPFVLLHEPVLLGLLVALLWIAVSGPVLRYGILPLLFPTTTCPGCRRTVPLVGRWKCGDHYTDHRERHVLAFMCCHGHRLEAFDCPRCRTTLLVQYGDAQRVRHGTALRLRATRLVADRGTDSIVLGHDPHRRPVVLPPERLAWHAAITGGTGRGKSTLLLNIVRQLMVQGEGLTVLDPGGDLALAVLQQVPPEREADILFLDLADREHPFPLNILSARDAEEGAMLVEELLSVFHRLHGDAWGPLLSHQLRMGLRAAMLTGGSLQDVLLLFTDARVRARIVSQIRDPLLRTFWMEEFPTIPPIRRGAVTNKLVPLVTHPLLGPMIGAPTCIVDADALIAERQILIVNLASGSPGDDVSVLLGSFLVQKIIAAAFRQARLPERDRVPHVLVVDEFQRFMHESASFDQILAEARKYRLRLLVANQFAEQLDPGVRAALFGNVGTLAAFRLGHRDARLLAAEFPGAHVEDLMELGRGQCLVRIGTDWTTLRTLPPPLRPEDDPMPRIVAATFDCIRAFAEQSAHPKPAPDETEEEFVC